MLQQTNNSTTVNILGLYFNKEKERFNCRHFFSLRIREGVAFFSRLLFLPPYLGWGCLVFLQLGKPHRDVWVMIESGWWICSSLLESYCGFLPRNCTVLHTKIIKKRPLLSRSLHPSWWEKQNYNSTHSIIMAFIRQFTWWLAPWI